MSKSNENHNNKTNKIDKIYNAIYSQENINFKQRNIQSPPKIKRALQGSTPIRLNCRTPTMNACFTPTSLLRKVTQSPFRQSPFKHSPIIKNHVIKKHKGEQTKNLECIDDRLIVAVRIRPLKDEEKGGGVISIVKCTNNEIKLQTNSDIIYTFQYDYVFNSNNILTDKPASQEEVYSKIANPLIERAFEGYNACLFAYGQTGSGKSYSMMGINSFDYANCDDAENKMLNIEAGIIPRFCYHVFQYIKENNVHAEIEVSFCEIYNEKIHDLLYSSDSSNDPKEKRIALKTREHPVWGPYVVGLNVHSVNSYEALQNWLIVGNSRRATASTRHNDKSSRSHSILNIILTTNVNEEGRLGTAIRRSKISLVDLAGSERISGSDSERMREGVYINKSLLTLGKVISSLSDGKNNTTGNTFIPYRESVLTWLLKENLGGNSKTIMLATISPTNLHTEETLATLRYACQARKIVNKVKINESEQEKIIRELRFEVEKLKMLHQQSMNKINSDATTKSEIESLREQLIEHETELAHFQKTWEERLKDSENLRESELRLLKRKGLAFEITCDEGQAYLVNLSEDPILSGTLFYVLPLGCVKIGRSRSKLQCTQPDIMLDGFLIGHNHCIIENINQHIYLIPESKDFDTYVNGELVRGKTEIFNGDRLIFGGSHYFRLLKPGCKQQDSKKLVIDFQLAYNEVLQKQEEALRLELEQKMSKALQHIENERFENERSLKERIEQLEMERIMLSCQTEICESEKKLVTNTSIVESDILTPDVVLPTENKENFIKGIKDIMKGPRKTESLHKIQLMVKEATQYVNDNELQYEFKYTQQKDEFGMFQPKILIFDRKHNAMARWPLSRLEVWLELMRNNDNPCSNKPFDYLDIEWEPIKNDVRHTLSETLNLSSSSLNCSKTNNVSLQENEIEIVSNISIFNTKDKNLSEFVRHSNSYLKEITNNVNNLQKLCQKYLNNNDLSCDKIRDSINKLGCSVDLVKAHHNNILKSLPISQSK